MKFSLSWLKEHLDTDANIDDIANKLTSLGLVVESVENKGAALKNFIVAEIVAIAPHPHADRLQICQVDMGDSQLLQVVCGAPNARLGLKSVLAPIGTVIPAGGITLKPTKIRQVDSQGMLCSYTELNLPNDSAGNGIIELPSDAPVGMAYTVYTGFDDPVFDIDVTPNRGDCLAIHGIARDLAAAGIGTLKPHQTPTVIPSFTSPIDIKLDLSQNQQHLCGHFTGRLIKGVRNQPSPAWLKARLESIGLRSISALVDITNYMAVTWARPLHVFDADKISGNLSVRTARANEKIMALDGREYNLDDSMVVVADASGPVSIAGILGGLGTGCTEHTTNVFLESAFFDRVGITLAARKLNIHTDSKARFERGVDPTLIIPGLELATRMIIDICGGQPSEIVEVGQAVYRKQSIEFNSDIIQQRGGLNVSLTEVKSILDGLGFGAAVDESHDTLHVTAPSWRYDIEQSCDIVEEVLRIKNYDTIPAVPIDHIKLNHGFESWSGSHQRQQREWTARRTLAARGLCEAITWSFTRQDWAIEFGGGQDELILSNPLSQDLPTMRPSILPNLLSAAARNQSNHQQASALFEVGSQFSDATSQGQHFIVAGLRCAHYFPRDWQGTINKPSVYSVKQDVLETLHACGINLNAPQITTDVPAWYHPNSSGNLMLGPKIKLATFGQIHPRIAKMFDLQGSVFGFEIYLDRLPKTIIHDQKLPLQMSSFQAVERDLAFIISNQVPAVKILQAIYKIDRGLIKNVTVFDVYQDDQIGVDYKSLAVTIRLEPADKTLTDPEIHAVMSKIIDNVKAETGGVLRS